MYKDGESSKTEIKSDTISEYRLQKDDLINIDITSTVDGGTELLNRTMTLATNGSQASEQSVYTRGYMIDADGNIELPFVKKIKVEGLTSTQAEQLVYEKLNEYLNHITVRLRLMSFRITYLGEFLRLGTQVMYAPKVTILQAISMGGDITVFADRTKLVIFRTDEDGKVTSTSTQQKTIGEFI